MWVTSNDVTDVGQYRKRFGHFSFSLVVPYRKAVPKQLHFVGCLDLARGHGAVIAKTVCQISILQNLEIASEGLLEWVFELESVFQEDLCGQPLVTSLTWVNTVDVLDFSHLVWGVPYRKAVPK